MSLAIVAAGVGIVSTGYSVYNSAHKASQAKKLAASNVRPVFKPDGSIDDVLTLSASNINNDRLLDYGANQIQQNESSGIDAILKSGGKADFQTINNSYGSNIKAVIASADAAKDARIAAFNNAAYNKAKSADASFQYNEDAPYKDTKQQEASLRAEAEQSKMDAISGAATTVANYGTMTIKPGDGHANANARRDNAALNSRIDTTLAINAGDPVSRANPDLNTPAVPAATGATIGGTRIVRYDAWGNPVYG